MAAVRILLGLLCLLATGGSWGVGRYFVVHGGPHQVQDHARIGDADSGGAKIIAIAEKEIGVREDLENDGQRVDQYNAYAGVRKVAWCASFVSWVFGQAGHPQPRTPWSPALFPADRITENPVAGSVMGIYFKDLKRIAHCGIVTGLKGDLVYCVEGNTNVNGGREGDGVFRRIRHLRSIYRFANWLKPRR